MANTAMTKGQICVAKMKHVGFADDIDSDLEIITPISEEFPMLDHDNTITLPVLGGRHPVEDNVQNEPAQIISEISSKQPSVIESHSPDQNDNKSIEDNVATSSSSKQEDSPAPKSPSILDGAVNYTFVQCISCFRVVLLIAQPSTDYSAFSYTLTSGYHSAFCILTHCTTCNKTPSLNSSIENQKLDAMNTIRLSPKIIEQTQAYRIMTLVAGEDKPVQLCNSYGKIIYQTRDTIHYCIRNGFNMVEINLDMEVNLASKSRRRKMDRQHFIMPFACSGFF